MIGLVQAAHRYYVEDVVPSLRRATAGIPDARGRQGVKWDLADIFASGVLGKLTEMRTLRQVEVQSDLASADKEVSFGGERLPDSTVHPALVVTNEEAVAHVLERLAGEWHRDKKLSPVRSRTIRGRQVEVVVYDGQEFCRVGEERPAPYYRKSYTVDEKEGGKKKKVKRDYWTCGVVHAVLASSAAPVCTGMWSELKELGARIKGERLQTPLTECRFRGEATIQTTPTPRGGKGEDRTRPANRTLWYTLLAKQAPPHSSSGRSPITAAVPRTGD